MALPSDGVNAACWSGLGGAAFPRKTVSCEVHFDVPPRGLCLLATLRTSRWPSHSSACPSGAARLGHPRVPGSLLSIRGVVDSGYKWSVSQVNACRPRARNTSGPAVALAFTRRMSRADFLSLRSLVWKRWVMQLSLRVDDMMSKPRARPVSRKGPEIPRPSVLS